MTEPTSNRSDYFSSRLATAAVEIGRLRWALHRVVELAADAPKLTDEQLRSKLLELGSRIRPLNEPAGDVPPAPKWGVSLLDSCHTPLTSRPIIHVACSSPGAGTACSWSPSYTTSHPDGPALPVLGWCALDRSPAPHTRV